MSGSVPQAELMRSLGRLVRGLSALFWGLPIALVISVQTAKMNFFTRFGVLPPVLANALLYYGLVQLGYFQKQERVWRLAVDRAKILALVMVGLSPFLYWWKMLPNVPHYQLAVAVLALSGLLFLLNLNNTLRRLAAMLPDETLRLETRLFTSVNVSLLLGILVVASACSILVQLRPPPMFLRLVLHFLCESSVVLLLLVLLLPIALTMALIWKVKEVIMASVFAETAPPPV